MSKEDCYICKELNEKGQFKYSKDWVTIAIEKGKNGKYRCFAWGEGEASISCNYCPNCGKQIEFNEVANVMRVLRMVADKMKANGEKVE